ncbi:3-demethylubiquinone-9 3-methyltransferase [Pontibacillus halophilus JSM 076056 = DSM 19796]|uniref:3-demethylubiquinone-9 3-methyltransferase n=1 Tax=Pontibacillus halophilus JSM 076056 = DSM 19796 TaxID=1385510 RepID=A0A0A5I991_9BACI|nr:VOC family protein [Pontibacillus halophilus]KGX92407.1 3-demethylubiquinone-9 3-methyltransferase [Pontibacillus halophilus JSM 076056 = DSM 19796]
MSISLNPYLFFDGTTREAVDFYKKALVGELVSIMTYGDVPGDPDDPLSIEMKNRIMHAHLKVGDADLMFSDTYDGMPYQPGNSIQLAIHPKEEDVARTIFTELEDGGQVMIPLHKTDFSPLYGMVQDKFGVTFNISVPGNVPQ